MIKSLFRFIFCTLMGWKTKGNAPKEIKKYIIIVAPHTSNWDFIIGILARPLLEINHVKFIGKSQLFKPPYGWIFRKLGGYPVDRTKSNNLVEAVVNIYNEKEEFAIAIAPEGTRKYVGKLKTGFYHIAIGAKIPIVTAGFDFPTKTVIVNSPFYPTGNLDSDMLEIMDQFKEIRGKHPEKGII